MVKNLKLLREELGLSQQKLAEMLNVTQQTIFKYERTSVEPDIEMLIKIAGVFDVSVDFLIGNSEIRAQNSYSEPIFLSEREVRHIELWRSVPNKIKENIEVLLFEFKKNSKCNRK